MVTPRTLELGFKFELLPLYPQVHFKALLLCRKGSSSQVYFLRYKHNDRIGKYAIKMIEKLMIMEIKCLYSKNIVRHSQHPQIVSLSPHVFLEFTFCDSTPK